MEFVVAGETLHARSYIAIHADELSGYNSACDLGLFFCGAILVPSHGLGSALDHVTKTLCFSGAKYLVLVPDDLTSFSTRNYTPAPLEPTDHVNQ